MRGCVGRYLDFHTMQLGVATLLEYFLLGAGFGCFRLGLVGQVFALA